MTKAFSLRTSPELFLLGALIASNGIIWALADADLLAPRSAVVLAGMTDALVIPVFAVRTLMANPDRFGLWHLYSALAAGSFGVYGLSALPEIDDASWTGSVLMALIVVKVGLLAMWFGSGFAVGSRRSLRATVTHLGAWISGPGIRVAWLSVAIRWALQFVAFAQGIVISGTSGHMADLGYLSSVQVMLLPIAQLACLVSAVLVMSNAKPGERKIWIAISALELLSSAVLSGRRVMLGLVCVAIVVWRLSGVQRQVSMRASIVGAALVAVMVGVAWPFFFYMRGYAINQELLSQEATADRLQVFVEDILPGAIRTFSLSDSYLGDSEYSSNVASRATLTGYLAQIVEAEDRGASPMFGDALVLAIQANIPKIIWWSKPEIDVEDAVNASFGLPRVDAPSTYAAQAYADLGMLGVIFCFAAFGAFLSFAMSTLPVSHFLLTRVFVMSLAFSVVFEVESELTSLVSLIRWWLIAMIVDAIFSSMSKRDVRAGPRRLTARP